MKYLLYLWRSIVRRPQRHFTLYSILTCAFLLPLVISIYRDSSAYGQEQFLLDWTRGATFHIASATEEDVHYFKDIPGLSQPSYAEGIIYLYILSDDEWKNDSYVAQYSGEILERMSLADNKELAVAAFDYYNAHGISTDPADIFGQRVLFAFNFFIILVSVFVAQSAYKSHLRRFSPEVGTLISCGANQCQIRLIFIVEFLIVFFLASLSAILISIGVMKLLFFLMEIKDVSGLAWVIFHINPVNTVLHLLIYFASSVFVLGAALWRYGRKSTWTLLHNETLTPKTVRRKQMDITPPPAAALSRFWRSRTNGSLYNCLLITIPVMTIFLFLFNYLMLDIEFITAAPEYELQIIKDVHQFEEISEEDIEYVEGIEGVKQVQQHLEYVMDEYWASGPAGSEVVNRLYIKLDDPNMHSQIRDILQERFSGAGYRINDHQEPVDYMQKISRGIYLLMAYLFSILFLFILIILCIKICDYIEGCRDTMRSLYVIGACRRDLYYSYMRQIFPMAMTAAIIPVAVSGILLALVATSVNVTMVINGIMIAVYIAVAALICSAYLYPAHRTLKKILRKL